MGESDNLDFRYAVANTEILIPPSGMLETFGNTLVNYIVVSELMDSVGKCHVRSGRMKLFKPQIITPSAYSEMLLEGFGEEARKYVRWLAEHEDDVHVLRYGYTLKRESFSEELVSRPIDAVLADAAKDVAARKDPYLALVRGVDEPWDVSLVRLFWEVVNRSAKKNIREMAEKHLFDHGAAAAGLSPDARQEIEEAFAAAAKDRSLVKRLGALLQKHGVFSAYEERFFALMKD
jgi:hypothetical protein